MSFNHQWHTFDVARHWPNGSVVLSRYKLKSVSHHEYIYVLVNNWVGEKAKMFLTDHQFQLIEEPRNNECNKGK